MNPLLETDRTPRRWYSTLIRVRGHESFCRQLADDIEVISLGLTTVSHRTKHFSDRPPFQTPGWVPHPQGKVITSCMTIPGNSLASVTVNHGHVSSVDRFWLCEYCHSITAHVHVQGQWLTFLCPMAEIETDGRIPAPSGMNLLSYFDAPAGICQGRYCFTLTDLVKGKDDEDRRNPRNIRSMDNEELHGGLIAVRQNNILVWMEERGYGSLRGRHATKTVSMYTTMRLFLPYLSRSILYGMCNSDTMHRDNARRAALYLLYFLSPQYVHANCEPVPSLHPTSMMAQDPFPQILGSALVEIGEEILGITQRDLVALIAHKYSHDPHDRSLADPMNFENVLTPAMVEDLQDTDIEGWYFMTIFNAHAVLIAPADATDTHGYHPLADQLGLSFPWPTHVVAPRAFSGCPPFMFAGKDFWMAVDWEGQGVNHILRLAQNIDRPRIETDLANAHRRYLAGPIFVHLPVPGDTYMADVMRMWAASPATRADICRPDSTFRPNAVTGLRPPRPPHVTFLHPIPATHVPSHFDAGTAGTAGTRARIRTTARKSTGGRITNQSPLHAQRTAVSTPPATLGSQPTAAADHAPAQDLTPDANNSVDLTAEEGDSDSDSDDDIVPDFPSDGEEPLPGPTPERRDSTENGTEPS